MAYRIVSCFAFAIQICVIHGSQWTSYGCVADDPTDPALRTSAGTGANTTDACFAACVTLRLTFFGVVNGECRCDNNFSKAKKYGTGSCDFYLYSTIATLREGVQTGGTGLYPHVYNLIDPDPSCRYEAPVFAFNYEGEGWPAHCPDELEDGSPGVYGGAGDVDVMAVHPNIVERYYYLFDNAARMQPAEFAAKSYGYDARCDSSDPGADYPTYFMSEAVQAVRFTRWSRATEYSGCDPNECGLSSHYTCCGLCSLNLWNQCGYIYVGRAITQLLFTDNSWNRIGSANGGGGGGHCGQILNADYNHQGYGYYPGGGGLERYGITATFDWEDHVFPHAVHFEEGGELVFFVQWFGGKQFSPLTTSDLYILYGGERVAMTLEIGDGGSGFYRYSAAMPTECEPYAFIAMDQNGYWHRLPQEEEFFFGTVSTPEHILQGIALCEENHYYFAGSAWVANGGPLLQNLKTDASGNCVGCSKVIALETYEEGYGLYTPSPTQEPTACPYTLNAEFGYIMGHTESCSWPFMTWADANQFCRDNFDSELATFTTVEEFAALVSFGNPVWIGLTSHSCTWSWESNPEVPCMNTVNDTYLCVPKSLWGDTSMTDCDRNAMITGGLLQDSHPTFTKRFVCNPRPVPTFAPTPEPTKEPTKEPTTSPTAPTTARPTQARSLTLPPNGGGSAEISGEAGTELEEEVSDSPPPGVQRVLEVFLFAFCLCACCLLIICLWKYNDDDDENESRLREQQLTMKMKSVSSSLEKST